MQSSTTRTFWTSVAPALLGSIAIALLTLVCYRLQPGAVPVALLNVLVVVIVSVRGNLVASVWVSLLAVASLDYFFTGPTFRLYRIRETRDVVALRSAAEDCVRGTKLELEYDIGGPSRPVDPEVEAVVVRVAQEAITNVVKHAAARTVRMRLSFETRRLRLSVIDDGQGFAVEADFQAYGGHWGLLGMRERASQIHGKLSLRSTPSHGTEVVLLVPYVPGHRSATASTASSSAP